MEMVAPRPQRVTASPGDALEAVDRILGCAMSMAK